MPAKQTCTLPSGTRCMCQPEDMGECPEPLKSLVTRLLTNDPETLTLYRPRSRTLPAARDAVPVPMYERQ